MGLRERKSTTSLARQLLRDLDYIVDQFRTGAISDNEARNLGDQAFRRFNEAAVENYLIRIDNSRFFRDPVPQHESDASPVSRSDG